MAINITEVQAKIEKVKQAKSRAEGALEQSKTRLKTEFNVTTIAEARTLLAKLEGEIANDQARLADLEKELAAITDWDTV